MIRGVYVDTALKTKPANAKKPVNSQNYFARVKKNYQKNKWVYYMAIPVVLYYIVFKYIPMFGIVIAFQDYRPAKGFFNSDWVGLAHFIKFFKSPFAFRVIRNTLMINLYQLLWGFPAPIILALLLNEVRSQKYKKTIQTLSYLPHFISLVVVCGILTNFSLTSGLLNDILELFGFERQNLLANVDFFRSIYVGSGIWQGIGWGSIIYLATLSNTDPNLYEAAVIDGAGRLKQAIYITIPTIVPIMVIQLIMRIGSMMSEGYEKVILLYSPLVYDKADIISSYVYRVGLQEMQYSLSSAIGLFNSVVNLALLVFANWFAKRTSEESLW
jgi:putative aldouronate transport system permease protein